MCRDKAKGRGVVTTLRSGNTVRHTDNTVRHTGNTVRHTRARISPWAPGRGNEHFLPKG